MSQATIDALIAGAGVLISVLGSAVVVAFRAGSRDERLSRMEKDVSLMATKDQVSALKEDVAEIKGMFRMTLKEPS